MLDLQPWAPSLTHFADWLEARDAAVAKLWSKRLNSSESDQVESAVAEAVVWDFIGCRSDSTRLAEIAGEGGVDFEFAVAGRSFLVEVTNISIKAATEQTAMPSTGRFVGFYGLCTRRIREKVRRKLDQARNHADRALLVAVTTLHSNASAVCVNRTAVEFAMGSPPSITSDWNPQTGESAGDLYQSSDLSQSVFLSPKPLLGADGKPIAQAKYQPISGFLLGGFGLPPQNVRVFGALNPEATHPFDPQLLPDVPFCSFREWPISNGFSFSWSISREQEEHSTRSAAKKRLHRAGFGQLAHGIRFQIERYSDQQDVMQ